MLSLTQDIPLPTLRADIEFFEGPKEKDGSPSYVIHDPVSGTFSKIGWDEATIFQRLRPGQTLLKLIDELKKETTLKVTPNEVANLLSDAEKNLLTTNALIKSPQKLIESIQEKKISPFNWLIRHYLYFRIPFIHPDKFLEKALPLVRILWSFQAKAAYLICIIYGLFILTQRFETYLSTFHQFYSLQGLFAYAIVIIVLKTAHEFGHAFVAKNYQVRVPTMGIAFMVFFPVAYSDVTDAWRLSDRKNRVHIALAGIKVEIVIGGIALALWGITPPGILNSICFILSSTTLLSTLLVNLNPAMRFDGYYILTDLWGIDNLSQQTGEYTKWFFRKYLLGVNLPCPVRTSNRQNQVRMILYSLYAWHYRFFLYLGIAVLVYFKFTKPLGITLFLLEVGVFIVRPIIEEIKMIVKVKQEIKINFRIIITLMLVLGLVAWAAWPLSRTGKAPAIYHSQTSQILYVQTAGQIKEVLVERGASVKEGDPLIHMESKILDAEIALLSVALDELKHDIDSLNMSETKMSLVPEKEKQLAATEEEVNGLINQKRNMTLRAQISGIVSDLDPFLKPGIYISKNQSIGRIISLSDTRIDAFVFEKNVNHIRTGQRVTFYPVYQSEPVQGFIESISPIREEYVDYMELGAVAAKELPLVKDPVSNQLTFVESYYRVRIVPAGTLPAQLKIGTGGHIRYQTPKRSHALELLKYGYSILVRESGF